jgi:ribosome-binding protein aMBF1 (putative translation factor)
MVHQLLAKRIREARQHAGLSADDLAYLVGVKERVVRYWEVGQRRPGLETLCCIAVRCDVSLAWLLHDIDAAREEVARAAMA